MAADNHAAAMDPTSRSHWLGVVALLEKKPEGQSNSGGVSLADLFGRNVPSDRVSQYGPLALSEEIREEQDFQLFHADCGHMRCRHDPERSLLARVVRRRRRRLEKEAIDLHMAQEQAAGSRFSRL